MKNVLIIGDSSALPREEVSYKETYYAQLKQDKTLNIENSAIANNTSKNIYNNLNTFMLFGFNPDIVILNYGIVDVYPRPYPKWVHNILLRFGLLSIVDTFLKKTRLYYYLGDLFHFKEVNPTQFEQYTLDIIKQLLGTGVRQVIICGIVKPSKVLLHSKSIDREIVQYNSVFLNLSKKYKELSFIDLYANTNEDFTIWDGYHYSSKASSFLANKITQLITHD